MLLAEKNSGIVEWRRGLLVLHSTDAFAKTILPKYFNTRNFKTFRRQVSSLNFVSLLHFESCVWYSASGPLTSATPCPQLNYYGFVHVRSFSTTGSTTTALWVNRDLAKRGSGEISSVLMLKRVEPCESAKTAEGRRVRKELAIFTVEEDIGVSPKSLQMEQIRSLAMRGTGVDDIIHDASLLPRPLQVAAPPVPTEVLCHHPPTITVPAPLFPKLSKTRQVSPTSEYNQTPFFEASTGTTKVQQVANEDAADGDVGAANLLLMLAKAPTTNTTNDMHSAIAPGQFLM